MAKVLSEHQLKLPDSNKTVTVRVMARESYMPNPHNTNKGSDRGNNALRKGMGQIGFARGILTAADRTTVAGNHSMQAAEEEGIVDTWIEVDSDGTYGIVTRRIDWNSANDPAAVAAAIQDNRINELNFQVDAAMLGLAIAELENTEYEIEPLLYTDEELRIEFESVEAPDDNEWGDAFGKLPDGDRAPFQQMTFTLHDEQAEQVKAALESAKKMGTFDSENENSNGNALARICELFLTQNGDS